MPTETVYGLAADATNAAAVAAVYAGKARPKINPLICHVGAPEEAFELGFQRSCPPSGRTFLAGPADACCAAGRSLRGQRTGKRRLPTLALRCPDHAVARALLAKPRGPLWPPAPIRRVS